MRVTFLFASLTLRDALQARSKRRCLQQKSRPKRRKLSTQFNHERNCILNLEYRVSQRVGQ